MRLALVGDPDWQPAACAALGRYMPALDVVTDVGAMTADIHYLVAFDPPAGLFTRLPNLRLVCSPGAGAERLLQAPDLPAQVPLVRVVDPATNIGITQYVVFMALRHLRAFDDYARQQQQREWRRIAVRDASDITIGILGLGSLGREVARTCRSLGFRVAGWSRTPQVLDGTTCFHGDDGLAECLGQSDVLVCLLPLTPKTRGLLDVRRLALLPKQAYLINVARGALVEHADLVAAIDAGHLSGAALDVHLPEPLPSDSPLWTHPRIVVTPHIAWRTTPDAMASQVSENIRRLEAGEPLLHEVHRARGY